MRLPATVVTHVAVLATLLLPAPLLARHGGSDARARGGHRAAAHPREREEIELAESYLRLDVGSEVRAGDVVELRWGALPEAIEEFEILLSLDDGRSFDVRVTPELEAGERRFRWRVPNLAAPAARLQMRMGDGRRELLARPSRAFRIVADLGRPAELEQFHEGFWWEGLAAAPGRAPATLAAVRPGDSLMGRRGASSLEDFAPGLPTKPTGSLGVPPSGQASAPAAALLRHVAFQRVLPLRI